MRGSGAELVHLRKRPAPNEATATAMPPVNPLEMVPRDHSGGDPHGTASGSDVISSTNNCAPARGIAITNAMTRATTHRHMARANPLRRPQLSWRSIGSDREHVGSVFPMPEKANRAESRGCRIAESVGEPSSAFSRWQSARPGRHARDAVARNTAARPTVGWRFRVDAHAAIASRGVPNVRSWRGSGDWRRGFEYAWQEPETPNPTRAPGLTWRETSANYWSGSWGEPASRHRHARIVDQPVGCLRAARGPARTLTHHHRRPIRHGRGGAGGDRRGLGIPTVTQAPTSTSWTSVGAEEIERPQLAIPRPGRPPMRSAIRWRRAAGAKPQSPGQLHANTSRQRRIPVPTTSVRLPQGVGPDQHLRRHPIQPGQQLHPPS